MYFLIVLFIIVLIKLYLNLNLKERFLSFTPNNTSTKETSKSISEIRQYDAIKNYYIKEIFNKFEDLEDTKNDIKIINNENNNIINEGDRLQRMNTKNKIKLMT
tara:strand:+ start:323 stop:634 length:312 start_codon:yes stop_codon:yes gene_type:complete